MEFRLNLTGGNDDCGDTDGVLGTENKRGVKTCYQAKDKNHTVWERLRQEGRG